MKTLSRALLTAVTLLVYLNSLEGDFVHDDVAAILNNRDVTGAGETGWLGMWTNDFWGMAIRDRRSHKSYRPLTILTFRYDNLRVLLFEENVHYINLVVGQFSPLYAHLLTPRHTIHV